MLTASQILQHANFPDIIKQTAFDIINIKVQGATNVASTSLLTVIKWLESTTITSPNELLDTAIFYLDFLANARPNEPLAKNSVKYIKNNLNINLYNSARDIKKEFIHLAEQYLDLIKQAKKNIINKGIKHISAANIIFTHCHSSTAENLITALAKKKQIIVIATETRPLYQGRITATNLIKKHIQTFLIVDSAAAHFIADDSILPVDAVLIGADELTAYGDAINKVGSFGISLSSHYAQKPIYVVTPLLKLAYKTLYTPPQIEQRDAKEVWPDAPQGLKIINPAFELIPRHLLTGFLTEFGLIEPEKLGETALKHYPWIKDIGVNTT